jgi:hypothetical protein
VSPDKTLPTKMSFDQNLPDQRADKESAIFIWNQRDQKLMYN